MVPAIDTRCDISLRNPPARFKRKSFAHGFAPTVTEDKRDEAEALVARLSQAINHPDLQQPGSIAGAEIVTAEAPVTTVVSDITSNILEEADMVDNMDALKVENSEILLSTMSDVREQAEVNEKKNEEAGDIATIAT